MAEAISNFLIPEHRKLEAAEIKALLEKHGLSKTDKLPKIRIKDAGLKSLDVEMGDVIEISRKSFVGISKYYRVVSE